MQAHDSCDSAPDARKEKSIAPRKPRRLSAAWNKARVKLRRTLCTLTAAGALTFGFSAAAAQAQPAQAKPATVSHHKPVHKNNYAYSQARLDSIEAKMKKTPLGRDILDFAATNGITIQMSNSKVMDDNPEDGFSIQGTYERKHIRLNGEQKRDDEIMLTLVHELRHAWHDLVIHESGMRLDPQRALIKDRMLEADVFAFETHFAYEYRQATGVALHLGACAKDDKESSACLVSGYAADRAAGMAIPEAYGKLTERTIKHVQAEDYDSDFISSQKDEWQKVIDNPGTGLPHFGIGENGLTSDADFAATMRRVATVGMVPGATPSALAGWTDADFTSLEKTGGASPKGLGESVKKFDEARTAWNGYWQDFLQQNPNIHVTSDAQPLPSPHERPIRDGVHMPKPAPALRK